MREESRKRATGRDTFASTSFKIHTLQVEKSMRLFLSQIILFVYTFCLPLYIPFVSVDSF
jgi:hypothetical protein